jgi:hypothetical protein
VLAGGTAYAANEWTGANIVDGSLTGADVFDNTVSGADITNGSLTGADVFDNTLGGADITNNSVASADVKDDSLTNADIQNFSLGNGDFLTGSVDSRVATDNSLTGADVDESTLGTVPASVLGGLGRSQGTNSCDPESATFVNCNTSVTLTLSRPARILVIGSATARLETPSTTDEAEGRCLLGTTSGAVPGTTVFANVSDVSGGVYRGGQVSMAGVTGVFPAGQHSFGVDCNEQISGVRFDDVMVTAVALSDQ